MIGSRLVASRARHQNMKGSRRAGRRLAAGGAARGLAEAPRRHSEPQHGGRQTVVMRVYLCFSLKPCPVDEMESYHYLLDGRSGMTMTEKCTSSTTTTRKPRGLTRETGRQLRHRDLGLLKVFLCPRPVCAGGIYRYRPTQCAQCDAQVTPGGDTRENKACII